MSVIRRINKKQNLIDIPAFIIEDGIDTKYFQIFGLPEEIPTGKSSFIVGGSPFLKSEVKLKLEILDSNSEVIYTEPVFGYRDGVNRRVSIEVYDASQAGEAVITLLGEIDPNKSDVFIPPEWRGVYNVKYTRRVSINPTLLNTQPILFHKQPFVYINPLTNAYKEYIQQPEETRMLTSALVTDVNVGTSAQTTDVVTQEQSYPEEEQSNKAFDFMSLYNTTSFRQSSFSNFRMPFKFQLFSPASGDSDLKVSSGSLDDGMIGKKVIINNPQVDTTSPNLPTNYTVPSQYSSSIIDITNDSTLNLAKAFYVTGEDGSTKYPVNLSSEQEFTCSFTPVPTEQDSVINYFDLADISLSKLRTFSGDVKYVRVYAISQGSQTEQQFDLLGEFPLESQELLFDYNNIKSGRTGFFYNQTKINSYWKAFGGSRATTASGSGEPADSIQLAQTGSLIRYAMDISGSNAGLNQEIMVQTSHSFSLSKSVPYELSFKAYGSRAPKTISGGDKVGKARVDFFISGSNFNPNHNFGGTYGKKILSIDFDDSDKFPELTNLQSYDWNKTYLNGMFIPLASGVGKLQVRVSSGRWHIADVSLRPAADTNFSPEVARIFAEMPPSRNRPDTVRFLLEFVNNDGVKADAVVLSPSIVFPGANFAIQGDNNVLSGSMFVSNAVGEGIEMAGLSSAFFRTIGWEGFTSASAGKSGGFIIYSGSVLPDSPDNYAGAGIEIHDGNTGSSERFLQFRTDDGTGNAIFKVKTDDYLFGISGSGGVESYISGADGKLEISSSNFQITNTGDVNMSGNVTATAGYIGNWQILNDNIVGSNITMDADSSRIYKTDSNGELDGYYMDFTPGNNYYVRFGTDFAVSSSGTLIASGAKIEGVITASEGFIANWTIAPNTINKLTDGTYTGMSAVGDARFFAGAANLNAGTSSAVFNVKDDGQISGSEVLFTGGRIAGYTISGNTLSASNFVLDASGKSITLGDTDTDDVFIVDADTGIQLGHNTFSSAPFSVTKAGVLKAESGKIAGWEILDTQIRTVPDAGVGGQYIEGETGLVIKSSGGIETSDFATGLKGWRISSLGNGSAEFENMRIRGTLRTTVFEKESVNVVGGQLMVANSTTLEPLKDVSGSIVAGAASMSGADVTMSVANASGFVSGEIIKAKKVDDTGFIVEYMMVTGSQTYTHPSSSYSASIAAADMGAIDPDGLAGELYIGRAYGTTNVISSSIGTVDSTLATTGTYGTEANVSISFGSNSVTTQSILKIDEERFKVTSASSGIGSTGNNQTIRVLRDFNSTDPAEHTTGTAVFSVDPDAEFLFGLVSSAQSYNAGQVVVSTGKFDAAKDLSSGYILMNANPNDISTPYMDVVERTGSGVYDLQLRARLGDLSGLSSGYLYGNEEPGFGLYTDNGFFRGTIQAMTGSIHGILHVATSQGGIESGDKISIGRNVSGANDGIHINAHNYWYTTGAWKVGGATNYLSLDSAAAGNIAIRSSDLIIDTSTFDMSTDDGGIIQLGPAGSTPTLTSGAGIFLSGSGEFRMGDTDGNIRFQGGSFYLTGADINIDVTQLNISASGFTLSSPQASMSLGDSKEILLHATGGTNSVPVFKLDGGEISASNFFVSTGGNLTASNAKFEGVITSSEAYIGGWTVDAESISKGVTKLSASAQPGLYVHDSFGNPMVLIAEKSMFEIGSDPDEVYNESFEQDPNSQFSSAGRHVGTAESPIMSNVPSWSFSSSGPISHSITKRGGTGFDAFDSAVLGDYTFDIIHPGQFAPFTNASQSFGDASASYLSGNSYELTQIVSASAAPGNIWKGGNVVSFAGVAKMSHSLGGAGVDRGFQKQKYKVDYWTGTDWVTFIPKSQSRSMRSDGFAHYNVGARYNSVAGGGELPATTDKVRITLTGSLNPDVSYTKRQYLYEGAVLDAMASPPSSSEEYSSIVILNTTESAKYPYTELTFDNFRLRQSQPRVELSPDGFLLYSSDSSYIKMTPEGIDFRGGQGFSQTSTMMAGESLSDNVDVYGSLAAPSVQAYEADTTPVSTTGYQGNVGEYAMGNHRHALEFSTLNTVLEGATISNGTWQGNTIATGYGGTGATTLDNLITLGDHTVGNFMTNVSAGTGIDVTHTPAEGSTATVAVDVSDFMSNGSNNYVVTATGADAMNAEANLTFDGSTLAVTGEITSTGTATFANLSGSDIYGSGLYISSSTATNVIQVGADGSGGIQKWEWHRDGTRRWLIYNDGRTDQPVPQDSMVFKHGLVTDGNDHINFHMEQDDQTVYFHGDISGSANLDITGHITASGNISASGNIRSDRFEINGATEYIDRSWDGSLFLVSAADVAVQPGTDRALTVDGVISASGNINTNGDMYVSSAAPRILLETGGSHRNYKISAQDSTSHTFEIASGEVDGDASSETWTPQLKIDTNTAAFTNKVAVGTAVAPEQLTVGGNVSASSFISSDTPWADIRAYGAGTGESAANNVAYIQKAIDSLPNEGGTVFFPRGTYELNDSLWVSSSNVTFHSDAAVLECNHDSAGIVISGSSATARPTSFYTEGQLRITRDRSSFPLGTQDNSKGIYMVNTTYSHLRGIDISYFNYGLYLEGSGSGVAYNTFEPVRMLDNLVQLKFQNEVANGTIGWVNQNTFNGGQWMYTSLYNISPGATVPPSSGSFIDMRINASAQKQNNANNFLRMSMECSPSISPERWAPAVKCEGTRNVFFDCRSENNNGWDFSHVSSSFNTVLNGRFVSASTAGQDIFSTYPHDWGTSGKAHNNFIGVPKSSTASDYVDRWAIFEKTGIGTDDPDYPLHVSGSGANATIKIEGGSGSPSWKSRLLIDRKEGNRGGGIQIEDSAGNENKYWIGAPYNSGANSGGISIGYHGSQPEYIANSLIYIGNDGNIGINDYSPSYKLDVDGTGRFTGTLTFGSLSDGTITATAFESSLTSGAALIPTSAAVKTYVDALVTLQDLDVTSDSGTIDIDLDSETIDIAGGTGIDTSASGTTVTITGEAASTTNAGIVEIATAAETNTGTDAARAVSPDALEDWEGSAQVTTLGTIASGIWNASDIALGTYTSGNYVATVTGGTGIDSTAAATGEGTTHTLSLDLNELTTETSIADADYIAMVDATDSVSGKITFENLEDAIFDTVSGDITITEAGVSAIGATKVTGTMLNDNAISDQAALAGATVAQVDTLMIDDGPGTLKKVTFSNFEDSIFANVTGGDATIAAGGALTISANAVQTGMVHDDVATGLAGDGMTASGGVMNVVAGTGIDVTADAIAVDVSDFLSNGADDRIVTATGADNLRGESNLIFNATGLGIAGDAYQTGNRAIFNNFTSGMGGAGWRIDKTSGGTYFEVDNITVRNTLRTHVFQKDTVKATNGYLYISDAGVISATTGTTSTGTVTFVDAKSATFANNTIMWYKDVDESDGSINSVKFTINDTSPDSSGGFSTYDVDAVEGNLSNIASGSTAVRISGGSLLLDASSEYGPFMDVIGNTSAQTGSTVVRTGNLAGVGSSNFGNLSGYGFWASGSAYLEGSINATSGKIGNWSIGTALYSTKTTLAVDSGNDGMYIGTDGIAAQVGNVNKFSLTTSTGAIFANTGEIGGWDIGTNLSATSMRLNPGDSIELGAATTYAAGDGVWIGNDGTARFGNASAGRFQWNGTNVEIYNSANAKLVSLGATNEIAGWAITTDAISKTQISLNATIPSLRVADGSTERIRVGDLNGIGGYTSATYGVIGFKAGGTAAADVMFELSNIRNIIAGWTISETQLSSGAMRFIPGDAIEIGATTYALGNGIWLGNDGTARFGLASANRFQWSGTNIEIFNSSNQQLVSLGALNTIAGWGITTTAISKGNTTLTSATDGSYLGIGATGYAGGSGIFIGQTAATTYKISAEGNAGKMLWDNTKLEIQGADGTSVFTTTATGATIGGWTIDANAIYIGTEVASGAYTSAGHITLGAGFIGANKFRIESGGNVYMSGSISATTGDIGGWIIDSDSLFTGVKATSGNFSAAGSITIGKDGHISANKFRVLANGTVNISGSISATTGDIGAWIIDSDSMFTGTKATSGNYANAGSVTIGSDGHFSANKFRIEAGGNVYMSGSISAITGDIGGWIIGDGTITGYSGKATLAAAGYLSLGTGTDGYAAATTRIYIDGVNQRMSIGTGFKYTGGSLTIDGNATIGNWAIGSSITSTNIALTPGAANTAHILVGTSATAGGLNSANAAGDIAIWAGSTHGNRATAPFRVEADGDLVATSATITGDITATTGTFDGAVNASSGNFSGQVYVGATNNRIVIDGANKKFYSETTGFDIRGSGYASFAAGQIVFNADGSGTLGSTISWTTGGVLSVNRITATDGTIGAFEIDADEIKSSDGLISINSTGKKIGLFAETDATDFADDGVQLDVNSGTPRFYVGDGGSQFIRYEGGNLSIGSQNFDLSTSGNVSATGTSHTFAGTINAHAGAFTGKVTAGNAEFGVGLTGTGDGLRLDANNYIKDTSGAVSWKLGGSTNYISGDESTINIATGVFTLDTPNLDIKSAAKRMTINDGTVDRVFVGEVTGSSTYGIKIFDSGGPTTGSANNVIFESSGDGASARNTISGFKFSANDITGSGGKIVSSDRTTTLVTWTSPASYMDSTTRTEIHPTTFEVVAATGNPNASNTQGGEMYKASHIVFKAIETGAATYRYSESGVTYEHARAYLRTENVEFGEYNAQGGFAFADLCIGLGYSDTAASIRSTTNSRLCTSVIQADSDNGGWWINDRVRIGLDNTYNQSTDYDTNSSYALYVTGLPNDSTQGHTYLNGTLTVINTATLAGMTATSIGSSGVVALSGGVSGGSPAAQLTFGSYYDTDGTTASISHIRLYSTNYGFGIVAGNITYIANTGHRFYDDNDLAINNYQLYITNGYTYSDRDFGTFVASRKGFCGTYVSSEVQGIWSIGTSFAIDTGADDFGTLYGLGYAAGLNGNSPLNEHQILVVANGTIGISLGTTGNMWMSGELWVGADSAQFNTEQVIQGWKSEYGVDIGSGIARFENSYSANKQGIVVEFSGDSSLGTSDRFISFYAKTDGLVGYISSEVAYNTFTGAHISPLPINARYTGSIGPIPKDSGSLQYTGNYTTSSLPPQENDGESIEVWDRIVNISGSNYNVTSGSLRQGSIVASTGEMWMTGSDAGIGGNISMALPYVRVTTEQKDKAVFGVWDKPSGDDTGEIGFEINSLGEGMMLVTDTNGNVEAGDFICSSNRYGHGEKQDDNIMYNYTVAKVTQDYNFASSSIDSELGYKSALIGVTYHCG